MEKLCHGYRHRTNFARGTSLFCQCPNELAAFQRAHNRKGLLLSHPVPDFVGFLDAHIRALNGGVDQDRLFFGRKDHRPNKCGD
jgi:hypothetical protein